MKTQPIDFILSTLVLSLLGVVSFLLVAGSNGFLHSVAGDYYVIIGFLLFLFSFGIFCIIFCRTLLKLYPFHPGSYDMSERLFTLWKLFTVVYEFGRGALLPFTTVFARPLIVKLFGAKVGSDIALGGRLVDPELITIGNEVIIGQDSVITAHAITSGTIILQPVVLEDRATIGVNTVLMPGVTVGQNSVVVAGSVVKMGTQIPANELWGGTPAKKFKDLESSDIRG